MSEGIKGFLIYLGCGVFLAWLIIGEFAHLYYSHGGIFAVIMGAMGISTLLVFWICVIEKPDWLRSRLNNVISRLSK